MTTTDELLAAYADDALDDDERARVERYLADHPEADAEVEAMRDTLNQVRAVQQRPTREPAWDAMARNIRDGIAPPVVPLSRRIARPRVLAAVVAVAAAAVLVLWWTGRQPAATTATAPVVPDQLEPAATATAADVRAAEVDDLDGDELDVVIDELDPAALVDGDELAIEPVLAPDAVDAWTDDELSPAPSELELFAEPDYQAWIDSLTPEELSTLDAFLAAQPG